MRGFALVVFALCALAVPSRADDILLEEGFEAGFDLSGWTVGATNPDDWAWALDSSRAMEGSTSFRIDGTSGTILFAHFVDPAGGGRTFDVWFYDDLSPTLESAAAVTANFDGPWTHNHLALGTSCVYGQGHYTAYEGWQGNNGFVTGPARTLGWHRYRIQEIDGANHCFIDDQLLLVSTFQLGWDHIVLREDNKCTTGSSWFDDLRVYREQPVSQGVRSFGAVKALYVKGR